MTIVNESQLKVIKFNSHVSLHDLDTIVYQLTAVMVRVFVSPVSAVVDLITHLPLTDTAAIPTLELIRSTRRTLCWKI